MMKHVTRQEWCLTTSLEHRGYIRSMFPTKATGIQLIQVMKTTRKQAQNLCIAA